MMKISAKTWTVFLALALLSAWAWYALEYPQFKAVDLSLSKGAAVARATTYLGSLGVHADGYRTAAVLENDRDADAFLQRTLGLKGEESFMAAQNYEVLWWRVRFFKELEKEEYVFKISPRSGAILSLRHLIDDIAAKPTVPKEEARSKAEAFLAKTYGIAFKDYDLHEEKSKRYEHRTDYSFSWEKKGIAIPWGNEEGVGKMLVGATVSGDEITEFYENKFDTPEKFKRYTDANLAFGMYLNSIYIMILIAIVGLSVFVVVKKSFTLDLAVAKKFFLRLGLCSCAVNAAYAWNMIPTLLMEYPTMSPLSSFMGTYLAKLGRSIVLFNIIFMLPGLAGETLRRSALPRSQYSSFAHYVRSGFLNRGVARSIALGYLVFLIMTGVQAIEFYFGYKYFGVWKEWFRLAEFSSAYVPLVSAFAIGFNAAVGEEAIFRLFGITWTKTFLKNTAFAVILTSFIWGLGHAGYDVFPSWFRVVEIGVIGLILGSLFVRYGIIPVIVAHFVFNVFWATSAYLWGRGSAALFAGSLVIMALPIAFAAVAYFMNRPEAEKNIATFLSNAQKYNLSILEVFILSKRATGAQPDSIKNDLLSHGWDPVLVDIAMERASKK